MMKSDGGAGTGLNKRCGVETELKLFRAQQRVEKVSGQQQGQNSPGCVFESHGVSSQHLTRPNIGNAQNKKSNRHRHKNEIEHECSSQFGKSTDEAEKQPACHAGEEFPLSLPRRDLGQICSSVV